MPATLYVDPWICRTPLARLWGWLVIPLLLFLPFAGFDISMFSGNSDVIFYTNILSFVSEALKSGDFWPRWLAAANSGYGSPVLLFYSPLAYIITAILNLPLAPLHLDLQTQMMVGMYASQVLSGYAAWRWLKNHFSAAVAYSGSQIFVLLPFKIIYICLNGNLAQVWALAFLPWWMLAAEKMLEGAPAGIAGYALALAATYYMHPLTVIAFGAVPAAYVLWFGRGQWAANIGRLSLAHVLAFGLCLMQALPQRAYLPWVHPEGFLGGIYTWSKNFFHVDVMLCAYYGIIAGLVAYAIFALPALRKSGMGRQGWFWAIVIACVAFMTQRVSTFVWEHAPLLQYLQFPAVRLHVAALMGVTYLLCLWLTHYDAMLPLGEKAYHRVTVLLLVAASGAATFLHIHAIYQPAEHWDVSAARATRLVMPAEYVTQWGCRDPFRTLIDYYKHQAAPLASVEKGKAKITGDEWQPPLRIALQANVASKQASFALHQCYFPLWQAYDETHHALPLSASKPEGWIEIILPRGAHTAELEFSTPLAERAGRLVSALAFLCCLLLLLPRRNAVCKDAGSRDFLPF